MKWGDYTYLEQQQMYMKSGSFILVKNTSDNDKYRFLSKNFSIGKIRFVMATDSQLSVFSKNFMLVSEMKIRWVLQKLSYFTLFLRGVRR